MFINCPYCRALIATDPATDLPPPQCPQCEGPLREAGTDVQSAAHAFEQDADLNSDQRSDRVFSDASQTGFDRNLRPDARFEHEDRRPDDDENEDPSAAFAIDAPSEEASEVGSKTAFDAAFETPAAAQDDIAAAPVAEDEVAPASEKRIDAATPDAAPETPSGAQPEATPALASASDRSAPDRSALDRRAPRRRGGQATPSFARSQAGGERTHAARVWPAIAAIVALGALLTLQLLLADRARLAADARWRPLLEAVCGALHCDLPPWREPGAFTLLQRDVRQHPTVPGALRVSASFRNDARWPQPWPKLELTLSDVNGRAAGERRFEAREYLGGTPEQTMLASGETATVAMDILEPAAQIVAYDFRFR